MKFYDRTSELADLQRLQGLAFEEHSRMTVVTGRRRIGKTSLINKSCEGKATVYLFVSRNKEAVLCKNFITEIASSLNVYAPEEITSFASLFRFLMQAAENRAFNLINQYFNV